MKRRGKFCGGFPAVCDILSGHREGGGLMRAILHSDMNSYYASVEIMLNPELREKPVAVCGSRETRHGIVLAKSEIAKRAGVQTGMTIREARHCCGDLVIVPPQPAQYDRFSRLAQAVYRRYTDRVEPFGLDECWLDVTAVPGGTPRQIAEDIRRTMKRELGLTVSIGVSFNKVFAKLGSDMKKPDAVTEITPENFREIVWPLPAGALLGVGPATQRKLEKRNIDTIGQIAQTDSAFMKDWFGINGLRIWYFANGLDDTPVAPAGHEDPAKSYGHGVTTSTDMYTNTDVRDLLEALTPRISRKLRENEKEAQTVEISFRDNRLHHYSCRRKLPVPTQSTKILVDTAMELFTAKYDWREPLMSFTIRAADLTDAGRGRQLDFFGEEEKRQKQEKLERTLEDLQRRFGEKSIQLGAASMSKLRCNKNAAQPGRQDPADKRKGLCKHPGHI